MLPCAGIAGWLRGLATQESVCSCRICICSCACAWSVCVLDGGVLDGDGKPCSHMLGHLVVGSLSFVGKLATGMCLGSRAMSQSTGAGCAPAEQNVLLLFMLTVSPSGH
jgi:hypothetical protein